MIRRKRRVGIGNYLIRELASGNFEAGCTEFTENELKRLAGAISKRRKLTIVRKVKMVPDMFDDSASFSTYCKMCSDNTHTYHYQVVIGYKVLDRAIEALGL